MLKTFAPIFLLICASPLYGGDKLSIRACFDFPQDRPVSEEGRRKAIAYLNSLASAKDAARAIDIVCPQQRLQQVIALKEAAGNIKIDGADDDWKAVAPAVKDAKDNVVVFDKSKPGGAASAGLDLVEVSYICTETDLYLRFKSQGAPHKDDAFYSLQIYRDADLVGSVVLSRTDASSQIFNKGKFERIDPIPKHKYDLAINDIVEARVSRSVLPKLPPEFKAEGVSFSGKLNLVNFTKQFTIRPVASAASTTPAYLLARYAEKTDLPHAGLVPLALCLTESVLYANVHAELREQVIEDGLAMIAASQEVPTSLGYMPFDAVLAWSNRSMTWGGLAGPLLDKRGLITAEAYKFMCLNPRILEEVRKHLHDSGVGKQRTTAEIAKALDNWATSKNRYRWKVEVLEEWSRTQTPKDYYLRLYKEASADVKAGRDKICLVNGVQIDFTSVGSPNLDWQLYKKNGYFFGCCGDVAIMSMLAYKSLGIPDTCFAWRFGKEDALVHTFAGYYDRTARAWRSPQMPPPTLKAKGLSVLSWTMPALTDRFPEYAKSELGGVELYVSPRNPLLPMTVAQMRAKLSKGFSPAEYAELVYGQVAAGR